MLRGVLSGFLVGGVLSVVGAGIVSAVMPLPATPELSTDVPSGGDAPRTPQDEPDLVSSQQGEETSISVAPQVQSPDVDSSSGLAADVTATALRPQTGDVATAGVTAPDGPSGPGAVSVDEASPVLPNPQAAVPSQPGIDRDVSVSTETAARPVAPEPQTPAVPASDQVASPRVGLQDTEVAALEPAPDVPTPNAPSEPALEPAPAPDATPAAPAVQVSETEDEQDTPARPAIGTPGTNLLARDGARTSRLPGVSDAQPEADTTPEVAVSADKMDAAMALEQFAVAFDNPEEKPLMSIVLLDTGQDLTSGPVGLSALGSFPSTLTFAVDASLPDAADRAARYRSEGMEVMALVDLPPNLTAADTEVALSAALSAVPEAIGVMEGPGDGLQGSREMSDQVTAILADKGHGIVWQPKGLDTASKLAAREGLASQTLFRDFDSADQTPTVIRRFLDNAAFRAGQQGGVIMVGRVRPDTISALLLWGLQDRASRVAVSPTSAVLKRALEQ